jgi:hypothetical protein
MDPDGHRKSQLQRGEDVRLLGSSAGDPAHPKGLANRTRSSKVSLRVRS